MVGWHHDLRLRPWEWLPSVIQLRARSLYGTLGSLDPIFVDGEWLAPGDHRTLCLEPAAAALERAIVAPETVRAAASSRRCRHPLEDGRLGSTYWPNRRIAAQNRGVEQLAQRLH